MNAACLCIILKDKMLEESVALYLCYQSLILLFYLLIAAPTTKTTVIEHICIKMMQGSWLNLPSGCLQSFPIISLLHYDH